MLDNRYFQRLGLALAFAIGVRAAEGQSIADTTEIEVSASRAMVAHLDPGNTTFALDPLVSLSEGEPWTKPRVVRAASRTATIAKAVGASIRTLEEVRCGRCHLKGVSAHLSLAAPQINGSTAEITATLLQNAESARQPVYYQTIRLVLARTSTGWTVTHEELLSIS